MTCVLAILTAAKASSGTGVMCEPCRGTGSFKCTHCSTHRCTKCDGKGTASSDCPRCENGTVGSQKCNTCKGKGRVYYDCAYCVGGKCPDCQCDGHGDTKCQRCQGTGWLPA